MTQSTHMTPSTTPAQASTEYLRARKMMGEAKLAEAYLRERVDEGGSVRLETWSEAVDRVISMHRSKYAHVYNPRIDELLKEVEAAYKDELILGAQRALQFGGPQILKHEAKLYNCSASYADRIAFFQEAMYLLLCGCGVGFSVQYQHVAKLPTMQPRTKGIKVFQIPDSIEGWSDAFGVLASSYATERATFPEYSGYVVHFDYSLVRPRGALISGGFKAPGPEPLRLAIQRCEALVDAALAGHATQLKPITVYDFVMHMSDAVLSGGVRRSATICLFSKHDAEMLSAKTGNWYKENPQRGRSNNSVILKRDELTLDEWLGIYEKVKQFGEPGFVFVDDSDFLYNPCVEVGMRAICDSTGETGFQMCNLTEINGAKCKDKETFLRACRAVSILGTLQAGYTNFSYLSSATKRIVEREALLGCSITAWMNSPDVLFNESTLHEGAGLIKAVNREVAALIGINPAARTTNVKPSGTASVILGVAFGIHGEHAPKYFRNIKMDRESEVAQAMLRSNPRMVEQAHGYGPNDVMVSFPIESRGSLYRKDLLDTKQLEFVKFAQQHWVEPGTDVSLCTHPRLRHNVSNTISVEDWDEVRDYIFANKDWFAGISLLPHFGDLVYTQAPFTEVKDVADIFTEYGEGALFASGLIVDGLHAFNGDLWDACSTALTDELHDKAVDSGNVLRIDWVRRFGKFAGNFLAGDKLRASFLLKDCYNAHKWAGICRDFKYVDMVREVGPRQYVDVDTLGAQGCAGGACEIAF